MKNESLGIPGNGFDYINIAPKENANEELQSRIDEFIGISEFLRDIVFERGVPEFEGKNKILRFINY